jgi:hypothetical protein
LAILYPPGDIPVMIMAIMAMLAFFKQIIFITGSPDHFN